MINCKVRKHLKSLKPYLSYISKTVEITAVNGEIFSGILLIFDFVEGLVVVKTARKIEEIKSCNIHAIRLDPKHNTKQTKKESLANGCDSILSYVNIKQKNRPRQTKKQRKKRKRMPEIVINNPSLTKYWHQRYSLFSLFDKGIRLDAESYYSVTPEAIAIHIAEKLKPKGFVLDLFCGCGGNSIQFAKFASQVVAMDIDVVKVANAEHNSSVYGVKESVNFISGDAVALLKSLEMTVNTNFKDVEVIFMSPPWGGPKYQVQEVFDLKKFKLSSPNNIASVPTEESMFELIKFAILSCKKVAVFLPRNTDLSQLKELAMGFPAMRSIEIEHHIVGEKVKTICVYFFRD